MKNRIVLPFLLAAASAVHAQTVPPGLLVAAENPGNVPPLVNAVPGNQAFFRADPRALEWGRLRLTLPGGEVIDGRRGGLLDRDGSFVWSGSIEGDANGSIIVARRGAALAGTIRYRDRMYRLEPLPGGLHRLAEMRPEDPAPEVPPVAAPDSVSTDGAEAATADAAGAPVLDVLVAYTQDAAASRGGADGILATIDVAVAETNAAYQNSQVAATIRLVDTVAVSYDESDGFSNALSRLRGNGDGYMDEVHGLRDQSGADLVALVIDNTQYCGMAYLGPSASYAFSVVHHGCATGYFSFGHEIGHNQGSQHDRANAGGGAYAAYSYGYQDPASRFRTVMAYNCAPSCPRVQHFSNPDVYYGGAPTGIDHDLNPAEAADNARSISETAPVVAGFRTPPGVVTLPMAPTDLVVGAVSHDRVTLAWNDMSDNEDGFVVRRSQDYQSWAVAGNVGAGVTTFTDLGLAADTSYWYAVEAYNARGYSAPSNEAFATTDLAPAIPLPVDSVSAVLATGDAVHVSWSHDRANVEYFEILREKQNRKGNWTGTAAIAAVVGELSYVDQPGAGTYRYGVRAVNATQVSALVFSATVEVPKAAGGGGKGGGGKCNPRKDPSCDPRARP